MHSPEAAMTKDDLYDKLVADRIACRRCEAFGLTNPSIVSDGRFDSPEIGPWSRWQGGFGATLMIVGQDWGTVEYFSKHEGLDGPSTKNPTNEALQKVVREFGIELGPPGDVRRAGVVFLTNAILCLKDGGLQAPVALSGSSTAATSCGGRSRSWPRDSSCASASAPIAASGSRSVSGQVPSARPWSMEMV